MRRLILASLLLTPLTLHAQDAPQSKQPEMVLMPKSLIDAWYQWSYEAGAPAKIIDPIRACFNDNPHDGTITRIGPDTCPAVTQAIEERDNELTSLRDKAMAIVPSKDFWR